MFKFIEILTTTMSPIKELFREKIKYPAHMVLLVALLVYGLLSLRFGEGFYSSAFFPIANGLTLIYGVSFLLLAALIFWYGFLPTVLAAILLSLDSLFLSLRYFPTTDLVKLSLAFLAWLTVYEFWNHRQEIGLLKNNKRLLFFDRCIKDPAQFSFVLILMVYSLLSVYLGTKLYLSAYFGDGSDLNKIYVFLLLIIGLTLILLTILMFFNSFIPTIIAALILSVEPVLFTFGFLRPANLVKVLLPIVAWAVVYDLWKKRSTAHSKLSKKKKRR